MSPRKRSTKPTGGDTSAEQDATRLLAMQTEAMGKDHPHIALSLRQLAQLHLAQQRMTDALPLLERALMVSEQHLHQECIAPPEARLAHALPEFHEEAEQLYSLCLAWPGEPRARHLALSAALLRKGLSVAKLSQSLRTLRQGLKREDLEAFELLRSLRAGLSTLRLLGPGTRSPGEYRQSLEALSSQGDALEASLAKRSPALRWFLEQPPPAELPRQVAAALPRDGALIEFVALRKLQLTPESGVSSSRPERPARYLALLLLADGSISCADLGSAEPMDATAILLHRALMSRRAPIQPMARALWASALRPLLPRLGTVRRLFIAPDGWLALVPFTELHDGERFLSDAFDITQLTSGRELLPGPEGPPQKHVGLFLLGLDPGLPLETPS
jgi:hypothetical protein